VVHDGEDYLGYASLKTVLDNLIHRLEIPAMVVAATQSPDRLKEYADDPSHARFVVERLVPQLERRYPLREEPQSRGLMGASFGAVASLSGSFAFTDIGEQRRGPVFDPVVKFVNAFRAEPGKPADRIFMSCGMYESLIYENRSMVPLLQSAGMEIRYAESRDGHNWESWRDRMREGLSWLFPGPLWLVYE
jgi:enterochelin esterase family protein